MKKKKTINIDLDGYTYDFLKEVSKLSKVSIDDIVAVILSFYLIGEKKNVRKKKI